MNKKYLILFCIVLAIIAGGFSPGKAEALQTMVCPYATGCIPPPPFPSYPVGWAGGGVCSLDSVSCGTPSFLASGQNGVVYYNCGNTPVQGRMAGGQICQGDYGPG